MRRKILIVDDDEELAMIAGDMLSDYGYETTCVRDGEAAYELLKTRSFDLILLDINLPYETGFALCLELRKVSTVPIIFASARTSEDDRITGLDMGGDDYLPKPYSLKELLARVNALMRRAYGFLQEEPPVTVGDVVIDVENRTVTKQGESVSLSLKEFDLLVYMAKNKNKPLSKEELLRAVWGIYSEAELSTVAVHIRWLREKLEKDPSKPELIKTVWGVGYSLNDE
ncbi:MAG: response regulator transcription factor [Roseburia sp.]|nr:response regulator transcription factor [Roseburia sp.]MCM1277659.1 response regulator transcription factor [Robinsoniella sp.]